MKTILITGIGGDIAQSIASILHEERSDIKLIGTDTNLQNAGSLFVDEVFQVPFASSVNYLGKIKELVDVFFIDVIIPASEQEQIVFASIENKIGESCRIITAGKNIISIGSDKLKTINFLTLLQIPTPSTMVVNKENLPINFPCIFKARQGSGSKNVFLVKDKDEAIFFANKFPDSIFQELLEPDNQEITCAVYRTKDGRVSVLQLLRDLDDGGITKFAKVVNHASILEMCKIIANKMNLFGSINIQLRFTSKGPRIFEINPRFSSTVHMRHRLGFSDLLWSLDELDGLYINFKDIPINQCMVRVQDVREIKHLY